MCYVFHGIVFFHILAPYILSGKLTSLCPPFYSWVNQLFQNGAIFYSKLSGMVIHGGFLKWWYSQIIQNKTISVLKPMVTWGSPILGNLHINKYSPVRFLALPMPGASKGPTPCLEGMPGSSFFGAETRRVKRQKTCWIERSETWLISLEISWGCRWMGLRRALPESFHIFGWLNHLSLLVKPC